MMSTSDCELLSSLREFRHIASKNKIEIPILNDKIEDILKLLHGNVAQKSLHGHIERIIEFLFLKMDMDWIIWNVDEIKNNKKTALLYLTISWTPCYALTALVSILNQLNMGLRQELCLVCIEEFFKSGSFTSLLINESKTMDDDTLHQKIMTENLLVALNSLPNTVANKTLGKFSDIFHHELFFQLLSLNAIEAMEALVARIRNNHAVSCQFLSRMIGSFCSGNKRDAFLGIVIPLMIAKSHSDHIWRRLARTIFSTINDRHLESMILQVARTAPWYGCMKWVFDDAVMENRRFKFVLTHKLLFVHYSSDVNILKNIIGYIAQNFKDLFIEVMQKLFSVWSDASFLRHTTYGQHKYISQAILIFLSHFEEEQLKKHRFDLTSWLAPGMGHHFNSTDIKVRLLGMVVGECVSRKTAINDNTLDFGYEKSDETESLCKLLEVDCPPSPDYYKQLLDNHHRIEQDIKSKTTNICRENHGKVERLTTSKATFMKVITNTSEVSEKTSELEKSDSSEVDSDDDDDDLAPYDMSNYSTFKKVKSPYYIRDCMEGLLEHEDRDKTEVSLHAVTGLIKKNPVAAREVSLELCKILLALDDKYAIDNFTLHRMSALTELVIVNPEEIAGYLTHEFYEENYCLQHRLDILDVLTAAAKRLSSIENIENETPAARQSQNEIQSFPSSDTWRDIVDRRIEAKTRRFGKAKRRLMSSKANQFGLVAGCFFYPLLAGYDRRVRTMDLLGNDAMVLGKLLYAAGTIVYSATNTMVVPRLAKSLLEFVFEIRFHAESYVRQAILFCISISSLSMGKDLIGLDILGEIMQWMELLISEDSNERSRELATQATMAVKASLTKDVGIS